MTSLHPTLAPMLSSDVAVALLDEEDSGYAKICEVVRRNRVEFDAGDPLRTDKPEPPADATPRFVMGSRPSCTVRSFPRPRTGVGAGAVAPVLRLAAAVLAKVASTSWSTWRKATTVPSARPMKICDSSGSTARADAGVGRDEGLTLADLNKVGVVVRSLRLMCQILSTG